MNAPVNVVTVDGDSSPKPSESSDFSWIVFFSCISATVPVVLVLLGYGVSYAVESAFGVPHASLADSAFDLMDLSSIAVIQLLSKAGSVGFGWGMLKSAYAENLWMVLSLSVVVLVFIAVIYFFGDKIRSSRAQAQKADSAQKRGYVYGAVSLLMLWLLPMFSWLGVMLIIFFFALLSFVPLMGMAAGHGFIKENVIEPVNCTRVLDREKRLKDYAENNSITAVKSDGTSDKPIYSVPCVVVLKEGSANRYGRVVFSGSKSLVLFSPETGRVQRIPTGDVVIEPVGVLPSDVRPASAPSSASKPE